MTIPRGTDADGNPVNLVGGLIRTGRGSVPGVVVVKQEDATMPKAEKDGVYTLNGRRFKTRKGAALPEGAVMDGDAPVQERAQQAAPENKAKQAAPENRTAKKDGK